VFKSENFCQKENIMCFNNVKEYKFAMKLKEMINEDDCGAKLLMRTGSFTSHHHRVTSR